jgi:CRISPR-associated endonuclease Csn1
MVRVDVFRKKNRRDAWEYYLAPIYPHQVFDAEDWPEPPNQVIQANTDETLWPILDSEAEFMWSLYPLSYIQVIKPDGEVIEGYSRGASRSTGALTVSPDTSLQTMRSGIGTRTLREFRKFQIDRLGRRTEIEREKRTWRGAVCT